MATVNVEIQREKLVVPSQIVSVKKQNGKRIVKSFIADSSINLNGRGIKKEAIDKIMQTAKNKPYLLPPFLDHPQRPTPYPQDPNDDIELIHKTAKPYEAGIMYDLERVNSEDNPGYNAYIELTSPLAIGLFDEGILPRWMSMSIYKFDKNEPDTEITNAVVNNICAVRNPAYGAKARILGMCVGDRDDCKTGLRDASSTVEMTGTNSSSDNTYTLTLDSSSAKCPTMQAVEGLPYDDSIRFDPNTVDIYNAEVSNSVEMSANQSQPGTVQSETTVKYPASKRFVKKDGQGKVIQEGKIDDQGNEIQTNTEFENKPVETEVTKVEKETKEKEKTVEKDLTQTKTPKKISQEEENKEQEREESEEEEENKAKAQSQKNNQPQQQEQSNQSNDRIGGLEQQLKQQSKELERAMKNMKYYRRKTIEKAVNNAKWLKPEQKEERINRYDEMSLDGEDLELALSDAFGEQMALAKSSVNKEKTSSYQYHEDIEEDNKEQTSSAGSRKESNKLTLDLIRPSTKKTN